MPDERDPCSTHPCAPRRSESKKCTPRCGDVGHDARVRGVRNGCVQLLRAEQPTQGLSGRPRVCRPMCVRPDGSLPGECCDRGRLNAPTITTAFTERVPSLRSTLCRKRTWRRSPTRSHSILTRGSSCPRRRPPPMRLRGDPAGPDRGISWPSTGRAALHGRDRPRKRHRHRDRGLQSGGADPRESTRTRHPRRRAQPRARTTPSRSPGTTSSSPALATTGVPSRLPGPQAADQGRGVESTVRPARLAGGQGLSGCGEADVQPASHVLLRASRQRRGWRAGPLQVHRRPDRSQRSSHVLSSSERIPVQHRLALLGRYRYVGQPPPATEHRHFGQ